MLKENYQISRLKTEDADAAVALVRLAFEELFLIPSIYRAKGIASFIRNELNNPLSPYDYFVIKDNTHDIVGYCEFRKMEDIAFLNMIATHPDLKGKGIGAALLSYCTDFYKNSTCQRMMLDVSSANKGAFNWYQRLGFIETSTKVLAKLEADEVESFTGAITIENYPHTKALEAAFGFYMLEGTADNAAFKIGFIQDYLFIRGAWTEQLLQVLKAIGNKLSINELYLLAEHAPEDKTNCLDKITRMQLEFNSADSN